MLDRNSDWPIRERKKGRHVIDLQCPMTRDVLMRRAINADFACQTDGGHPNEAGPWYVTSQPIRWWGNEKSAAASTPAERLTSLGVPSKLLPLIRQPVNLLRDS